MITTGLATPVWRSEATNKVVTNHFGIFLQSFMARLVSFPPLLLLTKVSLSGVIYFPDLTDGLSIKRFIIKRFLGSSKKRL